MCRQAAIPKKWFKSKEEKNFKKRNAKELKMSMYEEDQKFKEKIKKCKTKSL
jgi:hypothetical protein